MRSALAFAAAVLVAGCGGHAEREQPHLTPLHSKLKFSEVGVDEYLDGVAEIASRTRQQTLAQLAALPPDQDTVFSPWALTRRERVVADANGSGSDPAVAAMIGQLGKWQGDPTSVPNGGVSATPIIRSQTALIADRSLDIAPAFLDLLAEDYDMGVYRARPGDSKLVDAVSAWAMGTLNTRFDRPMPGLGAPHGVYIADVTALLAGWQFPFRPEFTTNAPFTTANGSQTRPATMRGVVIARTAAGAGWRAAELPLADGIGLRLIVPSDPRAPLAEVLALARAALANAKPGPLGIALPRWSARADLAATPEHTGGSEPSGEVALPRLAPGASLSGWSSQAAAAFGEQGLSMAAPPPPTSSSVSAADAPPAISFAADRPFCFEAFDPGTGLVLLAGRVANPGR